MFLSVLSVGFLFFCRAFFLGGVLFVLVVFLLAIGFMTISYLL